MEVQVPPIRGLQPLRPVPDRFLEPAALRAELEREFDAANPPDRLAAAQAFEIHLGLLPAGADLEALSTDLLASQVIGFYDDRTRSLTIVDRSGSFGPLERTTVAHEYTHALQDQHFGLAGLDLDAPDQSDRDAARLALVEGDASLSMQQWSSAHLSPADQLALVAAAADPAQLELLGRTPNFLVRQLVFPYTAGLAFVTRLFDDGGWPAVDAVYARPPASTSQILHPERYLAGEAPMSVSLDGTALTAALGPGWSVRLTDTLGEATLEPWLEPANGHAQATAAAAGWAGDRAVSLAGPGGAWLIAMRTFWRDPAAATAFAAAARRSLGGLEGGGEARLDGSRVTVWLGSLATLPAPAAEALAP
ncbi:MAG TPA: hypothetical protein VFW86_07080 [Candidatus Limnocylindrales bacterium]|nr:hypothetical protein [Candidatus Limnocylindrales bacterium]